jgi:hypothetical protein
VGNIADRNRRKEIYNGSHKRFFFGGFLKEPRERQGIYSAVIEREPVLLLLLLVLLLLL